MKNSTRGLMAEVQFQRQSQRECDATSSVEDVGGQCWRRTNMLT